MIWTVCKSLKLTGFRVRKVCLCALCHYTRVGAFNCLLKKMAWRQAEGGIRRYTWSIGVIQHDVYIIAEDGKWALKSFKVVTASNHLKHFEEGRCSQ